MKGISKVLMKYLYRREWKDKYVTLNQIRQRRLYKLAEN